MSSDEALSSHHVLHTAHPEIPEDSSNGSSLLIRTERHLRTLIGTVTELEKELKNIFQIVHKQVYNRDPYPFEHRVDRLV